MKECFKCGESKPLGEFYKHPMMSDGRLNKCKECTKLDTKQNRWAKHEYYIAYDRSRANLPHRVKQRAVYQKTEAWKKSHAEANRKYRLRYPEKYAARIAVNNAVRDGRLVKPSKCESCGSNNRRLHGHHDDYSKPLDVRWLCPDCHGSHHAKAGDFKQYHYPVEEL